MLMFQFLMIYYKVDGSVYAEMKADDWCLLLMRFDLTGYLCVIRIASYDCTFRGTSFIHSDTQS